MRIAIPLANGQLAAHFGHCEEFVILQVALPAKEIIEETRLQPPAHQPGLLPKWLAGHQVSTVIAGGMGHRAQSLFAAHDIEVVVGAPVQDPQELAQAYLTGSLVTGANYCDH